MHILYDGDIHPDSYLCFLIPSHRISKAILRIYDCIRLFFYARRKSGFVSAIKGSCATTPRVVPFFWTRHLDKTLCLCIKIPDTGMQASQQCQSNSFLCIYLIRFIFTVGNVAHDDVCIRIHRSKRFTGLVTLYLAECNQMAMSYFT